jgi:hypothetical protein
MNYYTDNEHIGIAASLIQGKTTHQVGCISVNGKPLSNQGKAKLARIWKDIQYLILDEFSMLSRTFFAQLSEHVTIGKMAHNPGVHDKPFGNINLIVCGDPHQLPPVAAGSRNALYHSNLASDLGNPRKAFGRTIYESLKTVVVLRRQVRVSDPDWREFLNSLRVGRVQHRHVDMLKSLVLTDPTCIPTDFQSEIWKNVSLVTPRHVVRHRWNDAAITRHCRQSGNQLFICPANDTIRKRPLTMLEQYVVACANGDGTGSRAEKDRLPAEVSLAVGMKVMITRNVDTDLDIANGSRGTIVGIVLDPDEPIFDATIPAVTLKRLPLYILVKMSRQTRVATLPGLDPDVIPVVPASKNFYITMKVRTGGEITTVKKSVRRLQFPITPAYAFTDYRSQGQTIESVIVDISTPPNGQNLSLFNLYVALSRSSGRNTIRILRDFDEKLFAQSLGPDLLTDDERLEGLDAKTKVWWETLKGESTAVIS